MYLPSPIWIWWHAVPELLFHVSRSWCVFEPVHSAPPCFSFFLFFFSVKAGTDALVWEWALVRAVNSLLMDTDVVSFFLTKLL